MFYPANLIYFFSGRAPKRNKCCTLCCQLLCTPCCQKLCTLVAKCCVSLVAKNCVLVVADYSQATLDECKYYLKHIRSHSETGFIAVGYHAGQIVNHEIYPEIVQLHIERIAAMISWCENSCEIRRAKQIEKMHRKQRKEGVDKLGAAAFEISLLVEELSAGLFMKYAAAIKTSP